MSQTDTLTPPEKTKGSALSHYRDLLIKVGSALTDQAIFAGSNFAINILLARWMSPNEYGAFVVAYAWFVLVHNLYEAVLMEPMAYYASDKYASKFSKYMGYVFYGHAIIGIVMIAVLLLGTLIAHFVDSSIVVTAMLGASLAAPLMSIRWLVRQPFYVQSEPQKAVWGGVVYCILALPSMFALYQLEWLSPFTALITMGICGVIASLILVLGMIKPNWNLKDDTLSVQQFLQDHWSYSKWAIMFRLLQWLQSNIYYVLLPLLATLATSGALRSINNLIYPVFMANAAISGVLLPMFVRSFNKDKKTFVKRVRDINIFLFVMMLGYFLVLVLFGEEIISRMYDGQYDEYVDLPVLISLGAIPIAVVASVVLTTALRAMGWVKLTFQSKIIPTVLNVTVGILLVTELGILGANIATFMNASVTVVLLYIYFRKQLASDEVSPLIASHPANNQSEETKGITHDD